MVRADSAYYSAAFCAAVRRAGARFSVTVNMDPSMESGFDVFKPTIAAINGYCIGIGLTVAMACDFRIAAEAAMFGQPEINLGIIPGFGGTQRLPRLVGEAHALELNVVGEPVAADRALELGLATRVVPDHELLDTALSWARKTVSQPPLAIEQIKRVSAAGELDAGIDAEKLGFQAVFGSEDAREGISAFLEKRRPRFEGK